MAKVRTKSTAGTTRSGTGAAQFYCASPRVTWLHMRCDQVAVRTAAAILEILSKRSPHPVASGALCSMATDILALHRCCKWLCQGGWAAAAPGPLRTMLELGASAAIVTSAAEPELMGFRYSYGMFREAAQDSESTEELREDARLQMEKSISRMRPEIQGDARSLASQRPRSYWYSPDFTGPKEVLKRFASEDLRRWTYRYLSAGAHGGFSGMRQFRDDPDQLGAEPRPDPRAQTLVLVMSGRLLLEFCRVRGEFEVPGSERAFARLILQSAEILAEAVSEVGIPMWGRDTES